MALQVLHVNNFRNIAEAKLFPSLGFNLIYGDNGSGKSSLLEAIYTLGYGRSFRSNHLRDLIRRGTGNFVVYSESISTAAFEPHKAGIKKAKSGPTEIRINSSNGTLSELVRLNPVQLFSPSSVSLILDGPSERRRLLDWGLFHVEHQGYFNWSRFNKLLKQRNALLKQKKFDLIQAKVWDNELATYGELVAQDRFHYLSALLPYIKQFLDLFLENYHFEIDLLPGWATQKYKSYFEALQDKLDLDLQYGFTSQGPQTADIKFKAFYKDEALGDAKDVLSRGELKKLVLAIKLAQTKHFMEVKRKKCIFMIDDITSELDHHSVQLVCNSLNKLNTQVFMTVIDKSFLLEMYSFENNIKVFHVEHGLIREKGKEHDNE